MKGCFWRLLKDYFGDGAAPFGARHTVALQKLLIPLDIAVGAFDYHQDVIVLAGFFFDSLGLEG